MPPRNSIPRPFFVLVMALVFMSMMADKPAFVASDVSHVASANPDEGRFVGPMQEISRHELNLLDIAEQTLERECMERSGFRLWVTPRDTLPEPLNFPYVLDNVDYAANFCHF